MAPFKTLLAAAIACVGIAAAAAPVESDPWIGKNVVDRALDAFHRLSGWRPPIVTVSEAFCAAALRGDAKAVGILAAGRLYM